jgi:hypothetical protein
VQALSDEVLNGLIEEEQRIARLWIPEIPVLKVSEVPRLPGLPGKTLSDFTGEDDSE